MSTPLRPTSPSSDSVTLTEEERQLDLSLALGSAIERGKESEVSRLLQENADPNGHCRAITPALVLAAEFNRHEIVKILLDHKADPNSEDLAGRCTALHVAAAIKNLLMVKTLLSAGADPKSFTFVAYPKNPDLYVSIEEDRAIICSRSQRKFLRHYRFTGPEAISRAMDDWPRNRVIISLKTETGRDRFERYLRISPYLDCAVITFKTKDEPEGHLFPRSLAAGAAPLAAEPEGHIFRA